MKNLKKLGVNIDHIATLREARKINEPNPLQAVFAVQNAGAHQITIHLREDRRHIHERDLQAICAHSALPVNVECALNSEVLELILKSAPHSITIVPEKRQEVTTEGGLNLSANFENLKACIEKFKSNGVKTSLFIDPDSENINLAKILGANAVELHTGRFANLHLCAFSNLQKTQHKISEFDKKRDELLRLLDSEISLLKNAAKLARERDLECFAGHGLNYENLGAILEISEISELNIGHSIIARAVFVGLENAVAQMLKVMGY